LEFCAEIGSGAFGDEPSKVADHVRARIEAGFSAVKMAGTGPFGPIETLQAADAMIDRVAAVREVLSSARDLAIDFHRRVSPAMAHGLLPRLEPYAPPFVEERVLPEYGSHLAGLVRCSAVPIATGERLYSRWDFRPVLEAGVAVVQPDLSHSGGISAAPSPIRPPRRSAAWSRPANLTSCGGSGCVSGGPGWAGGTGWRAG
jgi:galactonate dehydratase